MLTKEYTEVKGNPTQKPDSAAKPNSHLTSGRLLARNTIWNLLGQVLPMAVGLVTIPPIIRGIGVERFGVLSLAWVVVGYFSLFDLGIGRALTKLVADKLGANEEHGIGPLAWTSLLLMFLLGVFGAVLTGLASPWLVHQVLKIPEVLQRETLTCFYLLAASIPVVTVTAGLRGVLEALQRFRVANLIRIPMSVFSFAGPLLVLPFSKRLVALIVVLIFGRIVACGAHVWACLFAMPAVFSGSYFDGSLVGPLVRFGSWMTINNLLGPLMSYMDRFFIGALLSVSAVAYYTTPIDMMLRLILIPVALVGVLFPAFAMTLSQDPERSGMLLRRGLKYIFLIMFPIAFVIVIFAPEGLTLWLGPTFSMQGTAVLRWAAVGVFINSVSTLPFVLIQSAGRPNVTAGILAAELPVYAVVLWSFTRWWGVEGTAIAWTARITVEALLLFLIGGQILPQKRGYVLRASTAIAVTLGLLYVASVLQGLKEKTIFLLLVLLPFGIAAWCWALTPNERQFMRARTGAPVRDSPQPG